MFSGCTVPSDSKETKLGSSDQEASPSAGKYTGVVLVPCCAWKCVPTAISVGVDISEVFGCHFLQKMFSVRVFSKIAVSQPIFLIFLSLFISVKWSYYQKDVNQTNFNSRKLIFTNIRGLSSNFVDFESFVDSNSADILALRDTNLDDSIDSGNFTVRGCL